MNIRVTMLLLGAGLILSAPVFGDSVLLRGAKVFTATTNGVMQDSDILVSNGKIQALSRDLEPGPGTRVIDVHGKFVTPGLFAGVSSLGVVEISMVEGSVDNQLDDAGYHPSFDVTWGFNPLSSLIPVSRAQGITRTMVAPVASGTIIAGRGRLASLDGGWASVDRQGIGVLFVALGSVGSELAGKSRAGAILVFRDLLEMAGGSTRVWSTTTEGRMGSQQLSKADQAIIAALLRGQGQVAFHADRASDILAALELSHEYNLNAVIVGGAEAWVVATQLRETGVPVLIDPLNNGPSNFDSLGARLDNATLLYRAGVKFAFYHGGSGRFNSHQAHKVRQGAGNAVAHGLPWEAAMLALTRWPAEIWQRGSSLGQLRPGMVADLVVWDADPLEVTSAAELVLIAGEPMPMSSRQTKLMQRYRNLEGKSQ